MITDANSKIKTTRPQSPPIPSHVPPLERKYGTPIGEGSDRIKKEDTKIHAR